MTEEEIVLATQYRDDHNRKGFYKLAIWKKKRKEVLDLDHHECVRCKHLYGRYTRATEVHHRLYFGKHPEHALDIWVDGERNLISLCKACHNAVHPEKQKKTTKEPVTQERW